MSLIDDGTDVESFSDHLLKHSCTCSHYYSDDPLDPHEDSCELWDSRDYVKGWADWDPDAARLVWRAPDDDDDEFDPITGEVVPGGLPRQESDYYTAQAWPDLVDKGTAAPAVWKCSHYQYELFLPNGYPVYASTAFWSDRPKSMAVPDLGVYLSNDWIPDCEAYHIGCPDYGTPLPKIQHVMKMAREVLKASAEGKLVEVGCMGGHGRTGMFLSILVVMASDGEMSGEQAVAYVRKNYCDRAVETGDQKWYVECVRSELLGVAWPKKPRIKKVKAKFKWNKLTKKVEPIQELPTATITSIQDVVKQVKAEMMAEEGA